jgi:hypothetical protein
MSSLMDIGAASRMSERDAARNEKQFPVQGAARIGGDETGAHAANARIGY